MSRIFNRFRDSDVEFTEEEVAAAELIVESSGKKVVEADSDFGDYRCFICGKDDPNGAKEDFKTNTGYYTLHVCKECKNRFKGK